MGTSTNLAHIIERGLASPRRAFTVYLAPKQIDLTRVILSFTAGDQLILGVAIDDEDAKPENEMKNVGEEILLSH